VLLGKVTLLNKTISPGSKLWALAVVMVQIGEPLTVAMVEDAKGNF